ncbi:MAG: MerR family transcriptional regulator [Clostridia bacterium]|nr:MerR family transcriptional regulator [Clostridia bacterium]MBR6006589.1 MerR family transcriptional regulator [Clostridia bacterium]
MSQYTTGELAKACGVTVRTVQYYDTRGILSPGALSEGGRRLYSEDDLRRMKIICFLRETGLSLNTIGQLQKEEDPGSVISILLEQQRKELLAEIGDRSEKLRKLEDLEKGLRVLKNRPGFSIETIGDAANLMENNKKRSRMLLIMGLIGVPLAVLQWTSIVLWIKNGVWWPFAVWAVLAIVFAVISVRYYYRHTAYICPQCHEVFRPPMRDFMWSAHTPKTRKLTCTACGHRGYCVETWAEPQENGRPDNQ